MVFSWLVLTIFFLSYLDSLLMSLLVLELFGLFLFFMSSSFLCGLMSSSFLVVLFSIFVMGGVIGLSSLIVLVSFTGIDYLSVSSILKF